MCGEESPVFTVVCIMLQLAYTLPYYWSYSHKLCWQTDVKKKTKAKKTLFIKPRIEIQKDVQNYCPLMLFQNILDVIAAPV